VHELPQPSGRTARACASDRAPASGRTAPRWAAGACLRAVRVPPPTSTSRLGRTIQWGQLPPQLGSGRTVPGPGERAQGVPCRTGGSCAGHGLQGTGHECRRDGQGRQGSHRGPHGLCHRSPPSLVWACRRASTLALPPCGTTHSSRAVKAVPRSEIRNWSPPGQQAEELATRLAAREACILQRECGPLTSRSTVELDR
jgi:hypothetical protein